MVAAVTADGASITTKLVAAWSTAGRYCQVVVVLSTDPLEHTFCQLGEKKYKL